MPQQFIKTSALFGLLLMSDSAFSTCSDVKRTDLANHLTSISPGDTYLNAGGDFANDKTPNGGFDLPVWVVMVDESGKVCHVVNRKIFSTDQNPNTNADISDSWLGSRIIAAQKAFTANAFSVDYYAISTANLFGPTQSNQSLFGLQHSLPVDAFPAYKKSSTRFGTVKDPMINQRVGGLNVFGGGLALYTQKPDGTGSTQTVKIGAIGVSGDTSCTDHVIAWKLRAKLGLDKVPRGPTTAGDMFDKMGNPMNLGGIKGDELYMDEAKIGTAEATGWEHAACPNTPLTFERHQGALVGHGPGGTEFTQ